jgi:oxygen-independent coproporphyrinogen-3 oxidase
MEANPSSISLQSLQSFRSYGINRISMGVQALNPSLLKLLGRVHSPETALESLDTVFQAGYENVSVDLLCGIPGQSEKDIEQALERLTSFPITHLSCYLLTLAPHHSLYRQLPNEDIQLTHLLLVHDWMTAHGFEHYEISNFAKPGKQAQHNLQYWKGESYLGLGPSAHSYDKLAQRRWKNVSSLHQYVQRLLEQNKDVREWTESLTTPQKELEKWMLALRLNEGFPTQWLDSPLRQSRAKLLESDGLLEAHPQFPLRKRLTARGFALSDSIIRSLA